MRFLASCIALICFSMSMTNHVNTNISIMSTQQEVCYTKTTESANQMPEYYSYHLLSAPEKKVYKEVYDALKKRKEQKQVSTLDVNMLNKVYQCVMNDHPEIFYTKGFEAVQYKKFNRVNKIVLQAIYTMDYAEIAEKNKLIEQYVSDCMNGITQADSDYDKIRKLYEYIILNTEYDAEVENGQNICSVMTAGRSVCQGYAKAMQYLCQKAGIEAALVTGYANGERHAWNLVYADGNPYFVDVTWGDASYIVSEREEFENRIPPITYDYLMVTTDMLCHTHAIDNIVSLPECNRTELNYYVQENKYFSSVDEDKIKNVISDSLQKQENNITIKCCDAAVYNQMKKYLITDQKIFKYLPKGNASVGFSENETQYTLSFILQ